MPLQPGSTLANYQILSLLGKGGMGEVYRAHDTRLGRDVALKTLPEDFSKSAEAVVRLEREAKLLASLDHANIAAIYGFEQVNETRFLVLQLVDGETLAEVLRRGPLEPLRALEICRQIAEALEAAHERGIIHRDLKPANVKITREGKVKVLDFGIAKATLGPAAGAPPEDTPTLLTTATEPGVLLGTPAYMSPEQARGESAGPGTDIWAFGCVLYECLTGVKVFEARSAIDSLHSVLHKDPDWSRLPAGTPPRIRRLLQQCLRRDRGERLQRIHDVRAEIEAALTDLRRLHAAAPGAPVGASLARSITIWRRAGLAVLIVLLLLLAGWQFFRREAADHSAESLALLPFETLGPPDQELFTEAMFDLLGSELGKLKGLKALVIPKGYTNQIGKNVSDIARELGVDAVVEGSVFRDQNQVRITVKLIDGSSNRQLWSKSYIRTLDNIMQLQGEVALAIAREIGLALSPQEHTRLSTAAKVNPAAFDDYLRGRQQLELWTREGTVSAIALLKRATTNDPNLAVAYAAIVEALTFGDSELPPPKRNEEIRLAAARAQEAAGNTSGEAQVAVGLLKFVVDLDWDQAEAAFQRGLELNPHFGAGHHMYAHFLLTTGNTNLALEHSKRFLDLDPYSPAAHHHLGYHFFFTRQFDRAIQTELAAVRIKEDYADSYRMLADAYVAKGMNAEAETNALRAIALSPTTDFYRVDMARILVQVGRPDAGRALLAELRRHTSPESLPSFSMACFHVALGEYADSFYWLRRAVQEKGWQLTELPMHPVLDPIRQDPRFAAILAEMKLPRR